MFRRFIGVFARPEHPLALFLDDLQWLDAATLDLLEDLVTHPEVRHLLLVGAYRDNEVDVRPSADAHAGRDPRAPERAVQEIVLAPLSLRATCASSSPMRFTASRRAPAAGASWCTRRPAATRSSPSSSSRRSSRRGCSRSIPTRERWTWDLGAHPRQGLHRQRGRPHGRQAAAACRA